MPTSSDDGPDAPVDAPSRPDSEPQASVVDDPADRTHHPGDLLSAAVAVLGVGLTLLMAMYAPGTTTGVAEDVHSIAPWLWRVLFVPVSVLVAGVTLLAPVAVAVDLAVRRQARLLLTAVVAAAAATLVNWVLGWVILGAEAPDLQRSLSVVLEGQRTLVLPTYLALLAAGLTVAGPRGRRRSVRWSWNLLWVMSGVVLVTAQVPLPGALVSLLVGRAIGLVVRYVGGTATEQAYGSQLVAGVRHAGFDPRTLVRVSTTPDDWLPSVDPARAALARASGARAYALTTDDGRDLDLVVLDGDRQVVGMLRRFWRSVRRHGLEARRVVSLRQAAERSALLAHAAHAAGVRTPRLLAMSEVDDSMLLVFEHPDAVPLTDVPQVSDDMLDRVWAQLGTAHAAAVAHRALGEDTVLVDDDGAVWLTGWDNGDVASSELTRRIDSVQLLTLLATQVGSVRALDSAVRALGDDEVATLGPLLQTIAVPQLRPRLRTRKQAGDDVLRDLRQAIAARLPEADLAPEQLVRFGVRSLVTVLALAVGTVGVLATINVHEIQVALAASDWRWLLLAFALGLLTLVGAALALVAYAPVQVGLFRATAVQTAATFVALAAPAGIGPAALNLRLLTRRGATRAVATTTVALAQVSQATVTLLLLAVLSVLPGGTDQPVDVSPTALLVLAAVVATVGVALLIPQVRTWTSAKILPTLRTVWPPLLEMLSQPRRLALAVTGNLTMTLGYVFAFDAVLRALGQDVPLVQVAVIYLVGNAAGGVVPMPSGIGPVELALTGGLATVAGVNSGIAASVVVLFRVLTLWLRLPLGWITWRVLQRRGEL
ncbi:MAG: flippase-like domain-containing protein [Micrococcales bacterium]|nr:flippase-like domain-containing protein [Micrococcales bacterium]